MSLAFLIFASFSDVSAWMVDSLFNGNLDSVAAFKGANGKRSCPKTQQNLVENSCGFLRYLGYEHDLWKECMLSTENACYPIALLVKSLNSSKTVRELGIEGNTPSVDYMAGSAIVSHECIRCVSGCSGQYHELEAGDPGRMLWECWI